MTTATAFGARMKELRKEKHMSQEQFGDLLGIDQKSVSRYERGMTRPTIDILYRIYEKTGIGPDYMLDIWGGSDD